MPQQLALIDNLRAKVSGTTSNLQQMLQNMRGRLGVRGLSAESGGNMLGQVGSGRLIQTLRDRVKVRAGGLRGESGGLLGLGLLGEGFLAQGEAFRAFDGTEVPTPKEPTDLPADGKFRSFR